jgi:excinuclease ABC subunit C
MARRLAHEEWPFPQLIVVDGSTAQIRVAERVLRSVRRAIPVVGVVKDDHHRPVRIAGPKDIVRAHEHAILHANAEAHRFALTFHTTKRTKALLKRERPRASSRT